MSKMRAKMIITNIEPHGEAENIHFRAVSKDDGYDADGLDENNTFSTFTPSANLEIYINNPVLKGKFAIGESYYVDFSKAA